jgi:hypothetical protein
MRWLFALWMIMAASVLTAQPVVTSSQVSDASVTIYRDPNRGMGPMNKDWPSGYALISETRTITIPAGEAIIRFEGVAEGMLPESAIVTGLPASVREKNRDARLISPAGLIGANLKRRVELVRTNTQTGKVTRQDAIIQSGPTGGVILQTEEGVVALGCSGVAERLKYDGLPEGLTAKPTLSVLTTSPKAVTAKVTLTYIAQGFDWSSNYVAETVPGGNTLKLIGWATLVNGGAQSFNNARLQLVAGRANYQQRALQTRDRDPYVRLQCWPMDGTSTYPSWELDRLELQSKDDLGEIEEMVATGSAVRKNRRAPQMVMNDYAPAPAPAPPPPPENLGDLKLYRVSDRVTVAAQATKQVAMVIENKVRFDRVFQANAYYANGFIPTTFTVEATNKKEGGLGLALPAGTIAFYENINGNNLFVGESNAPDYADGEDVRFVLGQSSMVHSQGVVTNQSDGGNTHSITIKNANPVAINVEILLPTRPKDKGAKDKGEGFMLKRGQWVWRGSVPANGERIVTYEYAR